MWSTSKHFFRKTLLKIMHFISENGIIRCMTQWLTRSPTIYNKVNEVAKSRMEARQQRQMCCLQLVVILLFLISCSSLVICVMLLLANSQTGIENLAGIRDKSIHRFYVTCALKIWVIFLGQQSKVPQRVNFTNNFRNKIFLWNSMLSAATKSKNEFLA